MDNSIIGFRKGQREETREPRKNRSGSGLGFASVLGSVLGSESGSETEVQSSVVLCTHYPPYNFSGSVRLHAGTENRTVSRDTRSLLVVLSLCMTYSIELRL